MESVAGLIRKLQLLLHRQRFNRELEEELAFHREQVEQEVARRIGTPQAEAPAARFCSACGTARDADAKFCKNCGTKL